MYIFFDVYGEPARGIEPTGDREVALAKGRQFELEVFDTCEEKTIFDPRDNNL